MRVVVQGSQAAHDPLLVAMRTALQTQAGVKVEEAQDVPTLVLSGEGFESQVLSVSATGKVAEYLLKYEVSFRLAGPEGRELAPAQTVKLHRDLSFDRLNVIAKEKEEEELRRDMRRDAVQQILRRLAKLRVNSEK